MDAAYERLPSIDGLKRYIEHRIPTGDFLRAVLENDLQRATAHADNRNLPLIGLYCKYLYNEAPSACWGSPKKVKAWLERKEHE
jgi:molybdopterin-guanine dinucleotide biosynthesis protein A